MQSDTILSSRLAYDYLDWPEYWMDVRPLTHARQLALLNPGEGEVEYYRSLGWDVRVFVFSQGLIMLWHELDVQVNWLSLRDLDKGDWSKFSEMDSVVFNRGFSIVEDPSTYIDRILALLPDQSYFHLQIDNSKYFQFLLSTASREVQVARTQYTKTRPYSRTRIENFLESLEHIRSVEWDEYKDDQYFHPNRDSYRTITGPDCFVRLPNKNERLDCFIKTFRLKLQGEQDILSALPQIFSKSKDNQKLEAPSSSDHHQNDQLITGPMASIEHALASGNVSLAKELFVHIENNPGEVKNHEIFNMRGLLAFYSEDAQTAYLHFIDALEQTPGHGDYFLNLMDAGKALGRGSEVLRLFEMSIKRFPDLGLIEQEIQGMLSD